MFVVENGVVEVGDTCDDWDWENFEGEVWNFVGSWGFVLEGIYFIGDVCGGYGDGLSGGETGCLVLCVLVNADYVCLIV